MQKHNLPSMLTAVAWSFLLGGIVAFIVFTVGWSRHSAILDLNVLGIFVFFGLRRLSRGWRLYALVCAWLGVLGLPLLAVWTFRQPSPLPWRLYGQPMAVVNPVAAAGITVGFFLLALWQLCVLLHPRVRALFRSTTLPSTSPA